MFDEIRKCFCCQAYILTNRHLAKFELVLRCIYLGRVMNSSMSVLIILLLRTLSKSPPRAMFYFRPSYLPPDWPSTPACWWQPISFRCPSQTRSPSQSQVSTDRLPLLWLFSDRSVAVHNPAHTIGQSEKQQQQRQVVEWLAQLGWTIDSALHNQPINQAHTTRPIPCKTGVFFWKNVKVVICSVLKSITWNRAINCGDSINVGFDKFVEVSREKA